MKEWEAVLPTDNVQTIPQTTITDIDVMPSQFAIMSTASVTFVVMVRAKVN